MALLMCIDITSMYIIVAFLIIFKFRFVFYLFLGYFYLLL